MRKEPIRIAQIIGKWVGGGVEAVVMNYYTHIDRSKIQFDFICDSDSTNIPYEQIESLGGKVILIPPYQKVFKYQKELRRVLREGKYKIVHSHINTLSVFPLYAAKKSGVPVRIAHSHSTSNKKEWKKNIVKNVLKPFSKKYATNYFACTEHAGRWLFGNKTFDQGKVTVINNGINLEDYLFNEKVRKEKRKELNLKDTDLVIGHIGRFMKQKNHEFIIDIFNDLYKSNKNYKLMLIGQGPLQDEIKQKVKELGLEDSVMFLGQKTDANKYYQAMDLFLFPSLYEGLGMVLIEAQCSGLPCIASTEVPAIARVTDKVDFIDLNASNEEWINIINKRLNSDRSIDLNNIKQAGYDIKTEVNKLENKYLELGNWHLNIKIMSRQECKNRQLEILMRIHKICEDNNLNYYIAYGSLIGVIRHGGFIPWDDDIDIYLDRKSYNDLIDILKNKQDNDWLGIVDIDTKGYYYPFAKVVDKRTVAKMQDNMTEHGIWVDIFPIDGLPNNKVLRYFFRKKCLLYRSIVIAMTTDFKSKIKIKKSAVKKFFYNIAKIVGKEKISNKYNKYIQKYDIKKSKYAGCMSTPYKDEFEKKILFEKKLFDFENIKVYGPKNYDVILKKLYGDYMKLPPENNRKTHSIIAYMIVE